MGVGAGEGRGVVVVGDCAASIPLAPAVFFPTRVCLALSLFSPPPGLLRNHTAERGGHGRRALPWQRECEKARILNYETAEKKGGREGRTHKRRPPASNAKRKCGRCERGRGGGGENEE